MNEIPEVLLALLLGALVLLGLALAVAHVAEGWDAPEYPHSGYSPDCPVWYSTFD